jgi:large subunit ribosomal protein L15
MQLHDLQRNTKNKQKKRVGRGGTRGKTSGRGHKGQKQHGGTPRPEIRDTIKKIPKLRGHGKNRPKTVNDSRVTAAPVNVSVLEKHFNAGDTVTVLALVQKKIVQKRSGKMPQIKILGQGALTKKLVIEGIPVSKTAETLIKKAGGSIA